MIDIGSSLPQDVPDLSHGFQLGLPLNKGFEEKTSSAENCSAKTPRFSQPPRTAIALVSRAQAISILNSSRSSKSSNNRDPSTSEAESKFTCIDDEAVVLSGEPWIPRPTRFSPCVPLPSERYCTIAGWMVLRGRGLAR